jgi:hypothetical protein
MPMRGMSERPREKWRAARAAVRKAMTKPLQRACPECGAQPGQFCRTKKGKEITNIAQVHNARLTLRGTNRKYFT